MKKGMLVAIIVIVAAAILTGLILWYLQTSKVSQQEIENAVEGDVITYTDQGFSPKSLKLKAGTPVTVINDSSGDLQFSSDVHPTHTLNPELNAQIIGPGESVVLTLTKPGAWGYHDHLRSSQAGTIVVEE